MNSCKDTLEEIISEINKKIIDRNKVNLLLLNTKNNCNNELNLSRIDIDYLSNDQIRETLNFTIVHHLYKDKFQYIYSFINTNRYR